ncbi:YciI family protein [Glycomyces terrestris]|uniref:YCII-related domain-containing protein n=1 Tax=Glycomyces terrestris TaxID=2493553 RepID=A0A426V4E0_9ACTN|nr:YciI family protein [Glycomyces terrestris]RRS01705.1 hypothetical protein EIW28_02800 [Glycomyces terrestris]
MKYLLTINMHQGLWDGLSEEEHNSVYAAHERFLAATTESGEFICTKAFDSPAASHTVRIREDATEVATGLASDSETFLCGYYLVECASIDRAIELAALVPEARHTAVEVRPIIHEQGKE